MSITDVSICANALRKLGDEGITSLTDTSKRAILCNSLYAETRDAVLRAYPWNFAISRQALSLLSASPAFEYVNQFTLPTSPYCLRALSMYGSTNPWKIEGRRLLTDDSTVNLVYIARITDTAEFDPLFVQAFQARLSAEMAYAITGNNTLRGEFIAEYEMKLREARALDAQEGLADSFESVVLTEVR